jgi:hypothetical protein
MVARARIPQDTDSVWVVFNRDSDDIARDRARSAGEACQIACAVLANLGKLYHGDALRVIRTDDWLDDSIRELTP